MALASADSFAGVRAILNYNKIRERVKMTAEISTFAGVHAGAKNLVVVLDNFHGVLLDSEKEETAEMINALQEQILEIHVGSVALMGDFLKKQEMKKKVVLSDSVLLRELLDRDDATEDVDRISSILDNVREILSCSEEGCLRKGLGMKIRVIESQIFKVLSLYLGMPIERREKGRKSFEVALELIEDVVKDGLDDVEAFKMSGLEAQVGLIRGIFAPKKIVHEKKRCGGLVVRKQSLQRMKAPMKMITLHAGGTKSLDMIVERLIKADDANLITWFIGRKVEWAECVYNHGFYCVDVFSKAIACANVKKKKAVARYLAEVLKKEE